MDIRIRPADPGDALHVAAIVDIAGHGVDLDCWMAARDGDHSILSAARRLVIEDDERPYHFSKAYIIEVENRVAGGLIGGLVSEMSTPHERLLPHLVPLVTLEGRALNHWNILAIAIYAEYRCQGLGSRLLDYAVLLAAQAGARGVSVVTEDANTRAIALYHKHQFKKADSLPWIAHDERSGAADWLMMTKAI